MTDEEAIAIVAERAIWAAARLIEWVDYEDIGERDWARVVEEIERQTPAPNLGLFQAAYDHLAARTEKTA